MAKLSGNDKLVIVPDSCSLIDAASPIPKEFFVNDPKAPRYVAPDKRPKTFLDIYLNSFPRDRIKGLHIMDIVGAEMFGKDASGEVFDGRFKDASKPRMSNPLLKSLNTTLYDRNDKYIQLIKTEKGTALIRLLKQICELRDNLNDHAKTLGDAERKKLETVTHKSLKKLRTTLTVDKGEAVAKEYIIDNPQPMLFLSEEKSAREAVIHAEEKARRGSIYTCNSAGFLQILKDAGILRQCGLLDSVAPEMMVLAMASHDDKVRETLGSALKPEKFARSISTVSSTRLEPSIKVKAADKDAQSHAAAVSLASWFTPNGRG